jgi:hypothetical protein
MINETQMLTPQERTEFRELEQTFGSAGWRHITRVMQEEVENGPAYWFANATCWEDIVAARARMRAVLELLNYETITENRKANLVHGRAMQVSDEADDKALEGL